MITITAAIASGTMISRAYETGERDDGGGNADEHPRAAGEAGGPCRVGCGRRSVVHDQKLPMPLPIRTTPITSSSTAMTVALFAPATPRRESSGPAIRVDATR